MAESKQILNSVLRELPSVSDLLASETGVRIAAAAGEKHTAALSRRVIDELREGLLSGGSSAKRSLKEAENKLSQQWAADERSGIRRVINATGIVIHTNLGRAPLSEKAREAIADASGYCTLEYDIETGTRGRRGAHAERLLAELTSAEDAVIVNNCAAAALLVLTALASGGEVIVSRGELVEIGGDFRIPDVLVQSGARLNEVGTTNRTKLADYEKAIRQDTRLILRVHPSNYRIVGFTASPEVAELAALARQKNILFYEDAGSGAMQDLSARGLSDEPVIAKSIAAGTDVVTFSGDKLLGGLQSGLIVGRREVIEKVRKHPLYRTLRVDKLIYAALEATLRSYRSERATDEIPVLRMLSMTKDEIEGRVAAFIQRLEGKLGKNSDLKIEVIDGESATGGGAAPDTRLETKLIALSHKTLSAARIEHALRFADPPVISRIADDRVLIDLRTVDEGDEVELADVVAAI